MSKIEVSLDPTGTDPVLQKANAEIQKKLMVINMHLERKTTGGYTRLMRNFEDKGGKIVSNLDNKTVLEEDKEKTIDLHTGVNATIDKDNRVIVKTADLNKLGKDEKIKTCVAAVQQGLENTDLSKADTPFVICHDNPDMLYQAALALAASQDKIARNQAQVIFTGDWSKLDKASINKLETLGITEKNKNPKLGHLNDTLFTQLKDEKVKILDNELRDDYDKIKETLTEWKERESIKAVKAKHFKP